MTETVGSRLKARRIELGLTQAQVAEKSGLSQGAIARIEKGSREKPRDVIALAYAVRVNPLFLSTGKGPKELEATQAATECQRIPVTATFMFFEEFSKTFFMPGPQFSPPEIDVFSPDPTIYGVLVRGTVFNPRIRDGEIVVISELFDPKPRDFVFIHFSDNRRTIQELVSRDDSLLILRNLKGVETTFPADEIKSIGRIVMVVSPSEVKYST